MCPTYEAVLVFPGEFEDAPLPTKKLVGTRNQEFLETKRAAFEQYLQVRPSCLFSPLVELMEPIEKINPMF